MPEQNYANHRKLDTGFHKVLLPILLVTFGGSVVNLQMSFGDHQRLYSASLITVLTAAVFVICIYARVFALKAQDRAIRAEESLRYFQLTGKPLDSRLTVRQIVGLRFASDGEFAALVERSVKENLSAEDIKKSVKNWRADHYRV